MAHAQRNSTLRRRKRNVDVTASAPGAPAADSDPLAEESDDTHKSSSTSSDMSTKATSSSIPDLWGLTSGTDFALGLCLLILALAVRFFHLSELRSVIFDEGS